MKNLFFSTINVLIAVLIFISFGNRVQAQSAQAFYYHYDRKVMLNEVPAQCVVAFSEIVTSDKAQQLALKVQGLTVIEVYGPMRICRYGLAGGETWASVSGKLLAVPGVHAVYPVYTTPERQEIVMSGQIILQARNQQQEVEILRKCKDLGLEVAETINMGKSVSPFLVCETPHGRNPLEFANNMQASGLTVFAHPNFLIECRNASVPNDPQFGSQWFLNQSSDKDIDAPEAWDITQGSSSVVVAVIDGHGYDLNHTDMTGKFVSPYDAVNDDNDPSPENQYANHGTPCAGLIGANTNNGTGVAGIGYNVKVLPIVIGFNANSAGIFSTNCEIIARAASRVINTAGVAAVSNSWSTSTYHAAWEQSYSAMESNSRSGLGAVVLASAGNSGINTTVYPCAFPFVVGVGASDGNDQRAPVSNYGNMLNVVAPGVNNLTTDRTGNAGYNAGDYTYFNHTSAACPLAAGVCGLIASVNSAWEGWEIAEILGYTADKVGGYTYSVVPGKISTWNVEMGYGRINAFEAVRLSAKPAAGVSNITSSSALVSWNTINGVSNYTVMYRQTQDNSWITLNVTATSVVLSGLECYKAHEVKVRANFPSGAQGVFSDVIPFSTPCGAPANLTNDNVAPTSATVSWTASPCAYLYNVIITGPGLYKNFWTAGTTTTFSNLQPSTTYLWRIRTICTSSGSVASGFVTKSFTTPAALPGGHETGNDDRDAASPEGPLEVKYEEVTLRIPYPNPSYDFVTIPYILPEKDVVRIELFDSTGEIVRSILSVEKDAGAYSEQVDVGDLTPGVYMVYLHTNRTARCQRIIVL